MGITRMLLSPGSLLRRVNEACSLFAGTSFRITTEGLPYLRAPLGSQEFHSTFLQEKVSQWEHDIMQLSKFATSQPRATYSAMIHGLSSHWTFLPRTVKDLSSFLAPLEKAIRLHLLPKLCIHPLHDSERALLAVPIQLGGLGIFDPSNPQRKVIKFQSQSLTLWLLPS